MAAGRDFRVNPAPPESAALLARLHAVCFAPLPETPWSEAAFRTILRSPATLTLIAHAEDDVIAGLLSGRAVDGEAEILTLCVAPAMRRSGVASALLGTFQDRAPTHVRTVLEVAVDNMAARTLYETFGFALVGRRPGYYAGKDGKIDAMIYVRE